MARPTMLLLFFLTTVLTCQTCDCLRTELRALMEVKAALDPEGKFLSSWTVDGDPCDGSFKGVGCDRSGHVSQISLQGQGLDGRISPSISGLKHLTGLYLHYNSLSGDVPREVAGLTELNDLYLNVNNLSGEIPPEIGHMKSLQVLQLCYNHFIGSIPTELGSLKNLSVMALQSNRLTGAIPASLGELRMLARLDLSSNQLFGSIPSKLADAPKLHALDVRNNTLSGKIPPALRRLNEGFLYENNLGLCGVGFTSLRACAHANHTRKSQAYGADVTGFPSREIPESADLRLSCNASHCADSPKPRLGSILVGTVVVTTALSVLVIFMFALYRRRKQKLGILSEPSGAWNSVKKPTSAPLINGSPLVSLEYPNGRYQPAPEAFGSFQFNLEEVETATQYFSNANLLGKSDFSATYRGILRDGSVVAIKSIGKNSCRAEESELLKGLKTLASLRQENLVRFRGFCCSKDRGECFLIYDLASNGNLLSYLDLKEGDSRVLEWTTRVSIVKGIGKGIAFLHSYKPKKPAMVHQNISAEKVLIDQRYNPLLSGSGLHCLLTNDVIFSALKNSAAMGYLAPEYATTGRFTDKSDVYAYGILVFQILSGKRKVADLVRLGAEACRFQDYIDPNLHGRFFEYEATKLARIAWLCTHEAPIERPSMEAVVHELRNCSSCL